MLLKFMALVTALVHMVSAQNRRPAVLHQGESGNTQSEIVTAKTRAYLSCESGDIVVKVNFTHPFRGLMYAFRSRNSPCRIHGSGGYYYELRIPLKGCGTWQESPRVFMNNVTIRFHPALELEEDETKTVVCRYPPPLTPPPGSIHVILPSTLVPPTVPTRLTTAKLSEVEILIIICLLLFLSLLTLGIGIAYFCLKRRNIRIVRKSIISASSSPPSQLTKLSSSHIQPPSSLLSSVLGCTVRIPRAVPYSVPSVRTGGISVLSSDPPYEDYPPSTSTTETSGEVSEASVSSSSMVEDQADTSKQLLFQKRGTRSLLSIPKAILRKTGGKKWRTDPTLHHYSKASSSVITSLPRFEKEDQTVTTVLEPEIHAEDDSTYWTIDDGTRNQQIQAKDRVQQQQSQQPEKDIMSLYAQVDKKKFRAAKASSTEHASSKFPGRMDKWPTRLKHVPGFAERQVITEVPEESKTTDEVTKNTTVTTSVRKEIIETRIMSPSETLLKTNAKDGKILNKSAAESPSPRTSHITATNEGPTLPPASKSILIRDMADIYLTTTVETESRELKTTVSRDTFEEHAKISSASPETSLSVPSSEKPTKTPSPTENWNVVIRQRKPPDDLTQTSTDLDASGEETDSQDKPHFDVIIRTKPPGKLKSKDFSELMNIPPFEIPQSVNILKKALTMPTEPSKILSSLSKDDDVEEINKTLADDSEDKSKANQPQRTVRWTEDTKDPHHDSESTASSSDSFQSSESLRERSSSEVLEVAPTLPSQRQLSDHPMLERSTSEIVTAPEDHVRWIGGIVPVLENLSPEFLANIPIVVQGGFFNKQTPTPDDKNAKKE